jgi:hypothetical protein
MTSNDHSPESLFTLLQMQDPLGALTRAQFHIEACLQRVLERRLPRPEELPPLSFEHKLRVAVALGMQARAVPALLRLGKLREAAVKSLDAGLTAAVLDELFGLLAKPERTAVLTWHHERTRADGPLHEVGALQRFNLMATVLYATLATEDAVASTGTSGTPANEVVTFEWSAPAPAPRRARDFSSQEALYSWLIVSD